jgi:hypothetical protein
VSFGLPAPVAEREFWSSQEVCEFLGIPLSTLRYWAWQGRGPRFYKLGRWNRYKPGDVVAWAEKQADQPGLDRPKRKTG